MKIENAKTRLELAITDFRKYKDTSYASYTLKKRNGGYTASAKRSLKELLEAKKAYKELSGETIYYHECDRIKKDKVLISLTYELMGVGRERLRKENPRKSNVKVEEGFSNSFYDKPFEYAGRFKGYGGSYLICKIQSYGIISDDKKTLGYVVDGKKGFISACHGYRWENDQGSAMLVKNAGGDEYHISGEDLALNPSQIAKKLRDGAAKRKEARKKYLSQQAKNTPLDDEIIETLDRNKKSEIEIGHSYAVGNCVEGTRFFLKKLGLLLGNPDQKSIKGMELKKQFKKFKNALAESDKRRFLLALKRHEKVTS